MMRRLRRWLLQRRIDRILRDAGWPTATPGVFTGNVKIRETRYPG